MRIYLPYISANVEAMKLGSIFGHLDQAEQVVQPTIRKIGYFAMPVAFYIF